MATIFTEDQGAYFSFRWEGMLTEGEIVALATERYPRLAARNKLFDMTKADLSRLNVDSLVTVARSVSDLQPPGGTPKTAFVANDVATYSILTRYVLLAFQNGVRIEYRVFGDIAKAVEWLMVK